MNRKWLPVQWKQWALLTIVILAFTIGAFARIQALLSIRSLWADEACLANNLLSRPFSGLLQPLANDQGAPVVFLFTVKLLVNLLGNHERVLRLLPCLAALASLPLFYIAARRTLNRWGVISGLVIFALQPNLIRYAAEFKQYSSDATVTLALLLAGLLFLRGKRSWPQVLLLAAVGAVAVWCAFPSVFVLAGIGTTWAITAWKESRKLPWSKMAVMAAVWLASFAANYFVSVAGLLQNTFLTRFWSFGYLPFPPTQWADIRVYLEMPINLLNLVAVNPYWGAAGLFLVVGSLYWIKHMDIEGALILLPIGFLTAASLARLYPFAHRMVLFAFPLGVLLTAKGIQETLNLLPRWRLSAAVTIVLLICTFPLTEVLDPSLMITKQEDLGGAINFVRENWQPGDLIYVNQEAGCAFQYYAAEKGIQPDEYQYSKSTFLNNSENYPLQFAGEVKALLGRPRVWFVFSHTYEDSQAQSQVILKMMGNEVNRKILEGASVYLYDLRRPTIPR